MPRSVMGGTSVARPQSAGRPGTPAWRCRPRVPHIDPPKVPSWPIKLGFRLPERPLAVAVVELPPGAGQGRAA